MIKHSQLGGEVTQYNEVWTPMNCPFCGALPKVDPDKVGTMTPAEYFESQVCEQCHY